MSVRGYRLGIDWSDSGDPAATGEDDTSDVLGDPLVVSWGRDTTQAASVPSAADLGFGLNNQGGRYSPENGASPLAGNVLPGRRVVFQHTDTATGAIVKLFDGILDAPTVDPTSKEFTANCLDAWGRPSGEQLSTALFTGIRTGDAVNLVLDAIGWTGARAIDPGVTVMPYWWEEGTDAATAIENLVNSEGPPALAYVRAGTFLFEDREHRTLSPASTMSNGLYTHIIPAGSGPAGDFKMLTDTITYDHGLARIINQATFTVGERAPADTGEVWSSDTPVTIPSGTSVPLFVSTSDPFMLAVVPVQGVDLTVDSGTVTATLSRTSGASTIITLTASADAIVSRVALTAVSLPVQREFKAQAVDVSSVNIFGQHSWDRGVPFANRYDAQAIANRIVATYATNRPVITFEIENLSSAYMAQIRGRQLSDRIHIRDDQLGVDDDYIIERVEHTVTKFLRHRLKLTCEVPQPVQPVNVFTFDVAGAGFNDGLFGVDGIDNATNLFIFDAPFDAANQLVTDTYTRTVASGFGTADSGQAYTVAGGVAADFNVGGGVGSIKFSTLNVFRYATLSGLSLPDSDARVLVTIPAVATGGYLMTGLVARFVNTSNLYLMFAEFNPDQSITVRIGKIVAGAFSNVSTVVIDGVYTAGSSWWIRGTVFGNGLSVKVWPFTGPEPVAYQSVGTDAALTTGAPGLVTLANPGNTNVAPQWNFDSLAVTTNAHGFNQGVFGT